MYSLSSGPEVVQTPKVGAGLNAIKVSWTRLCLYHQNKGRHLTGKHHADPVQEIVLGEAKGLCLELWDWSDRTRPCTILSSGRRRDSALEWASRRL